jgi:hypothetical protein
MNRCDEHKMIEACIISVVRGLSEADIIVIPTSLTCKLTGQTTDQSRLINCSGGTDRKKTNCCGFIHSYSFSFIKQAITKSIR